MFVATKYFCWDKTFVATKIILVAAPANDTYRASKKTVDLVYRDAAKIGLA